MDYALLFEAVGSTLGGGAGATAVFGPRLLRRHDRHVATRLFLEGAQAIPGVAEAIKPASQRLALVEIDTKRLVASVQPNSGPPLRSIVEAIAAKLKVAVAAREDDIRD